MKRPLGQHFLFDTNILKKIIKASLLSPQDTVVEIGAGLGTLTRLLSEHSRRVIAIEIDRRLIKRLSENLSGFDNVEIVNADALRFPYDTINERFKVVSNIPYRITTPLLFKLLEHRDRIVSMTLLLQKEVAERIVASPNSREYGVVSIFMQVYTKPRMVFSVSRKVFSPSPQVDSAVVHFDIPTPPPFKLVDEDLFKRIVKKAFSHRRKTILNSLKGFKDIKNALERAGIEPSSRPETLSIKDFIRLTDELRA